MKTTKYGLVWKLPAPFFLFACLLLLASCGSYGNSNMTTPPGSASGASSAFMNVTDSPADRIIAFEVTVNAVTFVRTDNANYSVLSTPRRIEVTHLSGSAEPLVLPALPQGTYKSVTIDLSSPEVVYIDNSGKKVEKDFTSTFTLNIALNPNVTIGATPPVLTLDINAAASVTIDPITGNVTVNPTATIQQAQIPASAQNENDPDNGDFEHVVGQVTAATANSFTIALSGTTNTLTFTTDNNTKIEGATSTATLPMNATVRVEGHAQPDGSVLATEVEVISMTGSEFEGVVVATTGSPVTSFDIVVQDGNGDGMASATLGTTKTVTVGGGTKFKVDSGNINLGGISLPIFSAASLSKGQRVEAEAETAQTGTTFTADSVKLQQQALVGAVSSPSPSQFTLTVPDDSAFKLLTGKNTLTVFTPSGTELKNGVTITNAAVLRVRGLVFFDPVSGNYSMVAGRVTTP